MMTRKKGKQVSFDTMVKFFMKNYNIPTRKDVEKIMDRIDRLEKLVLNVSSLKGQRLRGTDMGGPGNRVRSVLTATDMVLDVIKRYKKGVGFKEIQAQTGFEEKKIRNIIFRLDKIGKIQRVGRGIYTIV
jgi:Fic family protein